jgi:predicted PurR-regulated permease PerM
MSQPRDAQRISTLVFYGAAVGIALLAYRIVQPFLAEIGWAVVLAVCLGPLQARLARRIGPTRSAAVLTVAVLVVLIVPLVLVGLVLVREGAQVVEYVKGQLADHGGPMGLFQVAWSWLHQRLPFLPDAQEMVRRLSEGVGAVAGQAAGHAGAFAKGAMTFLFGLVMTLAILFFLLKDAPELAQVVVQVLPFGREQNERLLTLVREIVSTSVTSTLVIAALQGILGGLAFVLLGIPGAPLWGCLMAVLAILPAVGAALVWAPAAIWLALSGSIVKGVVLALIGVLILGNTDNVVRPFMLAGTARMSTLMLIVSLLGGVSAFGFIGIVLGPVVAAVLTAIVKAYLLPETQEPPPAATTPAPTGGVDDK